MNSSNKFYFYWADLQALRIQELDELVQYWVQYWWDEKFNIEVIQFWIQFWTSIFFRVVAHLLDRGMDSLSLLEFGRKS